MSQMIARPLVCHPPSIYQSLVVLTYTWNTHSLIPRVADSWPEVLDDSHARADWGWNHDYDLEKMVREMVTKFSKRT